MGWDLSQTTTTTRAPLAVLIKVLCLWAGYLVQSTNRPNLLYAFFAVGSHVLSNITRLDESFLADLFSQVIACRWQIQFYRTYVVPLSCVSGRVSLKVRLLHECLSTISADKLLFALVIPQMVLERDSFWPPSNTGLSMRSPGRLSEIWTSCRIEYNCSAFHQCVELCGIQDLPSLWIPFHRMCRGMFPSPPYVCSPGYQICGSHCSIIC